MTRFPVAAWCSLLVLAACQTANEDALRRWATRGADVDDGASPLVGVSVSSYPTPSQASSNASAGGTGLKDLSDRGQAALIEQTARLLASAKAKPDDLKSALGLAAGKAAQTPQGGAIGAADAGLFNRTLAINVMPNFGLLPGERLDQFTVTLTLPDEKNRTDLAAEFEGYTIARAESSSATYGSISRTRSWTLGASLSPTLAGGVVGTGEATAGLKGEDTMQAEIKESRLPLNIHIQPKEIRILRQSVGRADISGDILISLNLRMLRTSPVLVLDAFDGAFLPDKVEGTVIALPKAREDLPATVHLKYLLRGITSGRETVVEGDDGVVFHTGTSGIEPSPPLIREKELTGADAYWLVAAPSDTGKGWEKIQVTPPDGLKTQAIPLYFSTRFNASAFKAWLEKAPFPKPDLNRGRMTLKVNGRDLTPGGPYVVFSLRAWFACAADPQCSAAE